MHDLNVIIQNDNYLPSDDALFFADQDGIVREEIYYAARNTTIYDLLVKLDIFRSKTEARKNWGREQIKPGYQEIKKIGKHNKALYILNPI